MTLFDSLFGGLTALQTVVAFSSLTVLAILAAVAWWSIRRAAACRPVPRAGRRKVEQRAWDFCPVCGRPRSADGSVSSPDPAIRPIRDAITVAGTSTTDTRLPPSTLLRRGWTREAAIDAEGRIVTPCDSSAVAWSLWGALNRAYEPGGDAWKAAFRHMAAIIAERGGGCTVSPQVWNRAAGRTHSEILAVSDEIQRRLWLELRPA